MNNDPIARFKDVYARADASGIELPDAASLATVDANGRPSVRMVLIKEATDRGFVFYTNTESRKGLDLETNRHAALCCWWSTIQEQVRVEGSVELVSNEEADAYFATRDRDSQIGAWASQQSRAMDSKDDLSRNFDEFSREFENAEVPRPPHWTGYRINPDNIEFWIGKPNRLHERFLYERDGDGWKTTILYP